MINNILSKWFYDSGKIKWKEAPKTKTAKAGDDVAFVKKPSGHLIVSLWNNGKTQKLQYGRVVWLLNYGEWPSKEIDHIDRNPANNLIENLRLADRSQNMCNRPLSSSGGVYKHGAVWRVEITHKNKKHRASGFKTKEEALEFRDLLGKELHGKFYVNHAHTEVKNGNYVKRN